MLRKMEDQSSEAILEDVEFINFRAAKKINNDLMDILRALSELQMRTGVGKEVKKEFMEIVTCELQRLEESRIVL